MKLVQRAAVLAPAASALALAFILASSLAVAAPLEVSPEKLDFGTVPAGTSATAQVTATWTGKKAVKVKISIAGNGSSAYSANPEGKVILGPDQPLTINLTFHPPVTATGKYAAALHVGKRKAHLTGTAGSPPPTAVDPFTTTGSMANAREGATATMLTVGPLAGLVLIAGGENQAGTPQATAELYNPVTGKFQTAVGSMTTARAFHTATFIRCGSLAGDVLITGGTSTGAPPGDALSSAEIFNAETASFQAVGSMANTRVYHAADIFGFLPSSGTAATASKCNSQQDYVLVAGGENSNGVALNKIEIFDPVSQTFNSGGNMKAARELFTATDLEPESYANATTSQVVGILMVGGITSSGSATGSSELYTIGGATTSTPYNGSSISDQSVPSSAVLYSHTATLLPGTSLQGPGNSNPDITTKFCISANNANSSEPGFNSVLIAGGFNSSAAAQSTAYVYTPSGSLTPTAGSFSSSIAMVADRVYHSANFDPATINLGGGTSLTGSVLLAGGFGTIENSVLNNAELFVPATVCTDTVVGTGTCPGSVTSLCVKGTSVIISGNNINGCTETCTTAATFNATGGPMVSARELAAAALIQDGANAQNPNGALDQNILITGGQNTLGFVLNSAERFSP